MENFMLWSISYDKLKSLLSFYATTIQHQRIGSGTTEMIEEMLHDMGIKNQEIFNWEILHFATNYLTDTPASNNWREVWLDSCEIKVPLTITKLKYFNKKNLIRTYAVDKTWGDLDYGAPVPCKIIADFSSITTLKTAQRILSLFTSVKESSKLEEMKKALPGMPVSQLDRICSSYLNLGSNIVENRAFLTNTTRIGIRNQLAINLDVIKITSNADLFKFAEHVQDIIYELGGTTNWNDLAAPK